MGPYIDLDANNQPIIINVVKEQKRFKLKELNELLDKKIKVIEDNVLFIVKLDLNTYKLTEEDYNMLK